ncbi:MAG TPA: GEVED domain-containing protein, partial [Phycisphaerae bacterium]|nr:GEVED domain-containing protein [Phycisphaerae bacterium]
MGWQFVGGEDRCAHFEPLEPRLLLDTVVDSFPYSLGQMEFIDPLGTSEMVDLVGPSSWETTFVGAPGGASDPDGDGLDQVPTEIVSLNLAGASSLGPVVVSTQPARPSVGEMEEIVNYMWGVLDVPPYGLGMVESFFDVLFQVEVGGMMVFGVAPLHLEALLSELPPEAGTAFVSVLPAPVELLDQTGQPTGYFVAGMTYVPNPQSDSDFGDAPLPYPTLSADNGASHTSTGQFLLGAQVDREFDGLPDPYAEGDDLAGVDDEDGVDFWYVSIGEVGYVDVEVVVPAGAVGYVDSWIDFNTDGDWDDAGEHVVVAQAVGTGLHTFNFAVPPDAAGGDTFARTRLGLDPAGLPPTGPGGDGEVEDQRITVYDPSAPVPKWEQYPEPDDSGAVLYGWNELSWDGGQQIAADDWVCTDDSLVTGIGWWGSFIGWTEPVPPSDMPGMFHIAVWTDVPAGADAPHSHPGMVIQDWYIRNYQVDWWGWDYDPRIGTFDAAFHFEAALPEPFRQFTDQGIYWVSIAAVYDGPAGAEYPWGWKTVRRDPESPAPDAAVVITEPTDPVLEMVYMDGFPIETVDLDGNVQQWDLAFELYTVKMVPQIKWGQDPDPQLSGRHTHDWDDGTGPQWITRADDWLCEGGLVTDLHWFGNYETDASGLELRGSGVEHFYLSIHEDLRGLPGPEIWGMPVPMFLLTEAPTGLVNGEGSAIYSYDYILDRPFDQEQDKVYWLDITAYSWDPLDPAMWRWQESARPHTMLSPSAERYMQDPWTSVESDMAFWVTSGGQVQPGTKWSQWPEAATPDDVAVYSGWDELSVYGVQQIVADDWVCATTDPVSAITWWGSFQGWDVPYDPANLPVGFHVGVWTDVPVGQETFSHPEKMVWETFVWDYQMAFDGWELDPRDPLAAPEAAFRFFAELDEPFEQPGDLAVYWVSISAVYDAPTGIAYPWGWLTRSRDPQSPAPDDAVRVFDPTAPKLGALYRSGEPLEWAGVSYDTAFVLWAAGEPAPDLDWGDAPRQYPTLETANGARHVIAGPWLGDAANWPDAEADGQPDPQALGDDLTDYPDESGVVIPAAMVLGASETLTLEVNSLSGAGGYLTAWIDWDANGSWEAAEQIYSGPLTDGPHALTVTVPTTAAVGQTFARFRITSVGPLGPEGYAPDGEVEDHEVILVEPPVELDWGDAPRQYPTLAAANGANHVIAGPWLGDAKDNPDSDPDGQPDLNAMGDDLDIATPSMVNDDEDGVVAGTLVAGQPGTVYVEVNNPDGADAVVEVWIDWANDGSWMEPGDLVFAGPLSLGPHSLPVNVPAGAVGPRYLRARISLNGTGSPEGAAPDGEVEDHLIVIEEPAPELDWGDAPYPYPTLAVQTGANHVIAGPWMGDATDQPDPEVNGQPDPAAMGDDLDIDGTMPANDDEDGVTVPIMTVGQPATILVEVNGAPAGTPSAYLEVWVDWDGDGSWSQAGDLVYAAAVNDGIVSVPVNVPPTAVVAQTFLRARISSQGTGSPTGPAPDGEVEDHVVTIEPPAPQIKWEQLPAPAYPDNVYYGWNELSVYGMEQIAADDWFCTSALPVTDIIWWGSFLGWTDAHAAPPMPATFHLAIWTDIPADANNDFSHPGDVIWENWAANVVADFAGWDFDPISKTYEAMYVFSVSLPRTQWFYQNPDTDGIYWLSIAAEDIAGGAYHPFGWKTRRRDPNSLAPDAAVRVFDPTAPAMGAAWAAGEPITWPADDQWDLAFELQTNVSGDPVKVVQLPDLETGMDVLDGPIAPPEANEYEKYLADDFLCIRSGPITEITFWGSYL